MYQKTMRYVRLITDEPLPLCSAGALVRAQSGYRKFTQCMRPFNSLPLPLATTQPVLMRHRGHQVNKHVIDGAYHSAGYWVSLSYTDTAGFTDHVFALMHLLGEIRARKPENQSYRASELTLLTAAISLWNTVYMERAVDALKRKGLKINEQLLSHLSPLGWEHINLTGDYIWKNNRIPNISFR